LRYAVEIKEEALAEMQDAYDYYEEQKAGLGERFLDNLDDYFERIRNNPLHFQVRRKPYREAFIKTFPFLIIYEIEVTKIIVYSIFNTSRNTKSKPKKK
tara:strand:+ start:454 stop:750 length:297 start_codon:yes stop_codon:yes gene_type:complete